MPTTANPMDGLYRRLGSIGLTRKYVRETIFPGWWDDEIALNPAGYAEALLLLSRHLGLDLRSLDDETAAVVPRVFGTCKFKTSSGTTPDELAFARAMATRIAQLAVEATAEPLRPLPSSGALARQEILGRGNQCVNLSNLVDYCWEAGIPVLQLCSFPKRIKRPDGLAAQINGRPAIVLCKQSRHAAWLLFILAHEVGHIALGHVDDNSVIIDESIRGNQPDSDEEAANAFALALLTGNSNRRIVCQGSWPNAVQLASQATELGMQERIDPGHLILNFAHTIGNYPLGGAALNRLEPGRLDAPAIVRSKMADHLDWSRLPEDSSEFINQVTKEPRRALSDG